MPLLRLALIALAAVVLAFASNDGWARHGGHGGRGGMHHHQHHAHSVFFFGLSSWPYYYFPPPYYYGPDYSEAHYAPPTVYVEKFPGTPTPETQGEIFCPEKGAYYPEVQECAAGWQRVIRPPQG